MKLPRPTDARTLALAVLLQCRAHEAFAQDLLDRALRASHLGPADRRLATHLVYGVLRRRGTLDAVLGRHVTRAPEKVEPELWDILRLGVFQLLLSTSIPPHAALHETVELAAWVRKSRAKGFINGVLRATLQLIEGPTQWTDAAAPNALPFEDGKYRLLTQPCFPDPKEEPQAYLAQALSLPAWLVKRWWPRFGWEECLRLGFWFAGPGLLCLRVNTLKTTRADLLARLAAAGIRAEAGAVEDALRLHDAAAVRDLPGFAEGHFVVQDESALAPGRGLAPAPGMRVLDLCAGPGGKTTHLAQLLNNQGEIVACDVSRERLQPLEESCERLGLSIVRTQVVGTTGNDVPPGPFDAALVDVPCSNTGVLGKRPEARWRLQPGDLAHLTELQGRLLTLACERVRPGGAVVYSTCSIEPEENTGVVQGVLQRQSGFALEVEEWAVPGRPADGGYLARLRRLQ